MCNFYVFLHYILHSPIHLFVWLIFWSSPQGFRRLHERCRSSQMMLITIRFKWTLIFGVTSCRGKSSQGTFWDHNLLISFLPMKTAADAYMKHENKWNKCQKPARLPTDATCSIRSLVLEIGSSRFSYGLNSHRKGDTRSSRHNFESHKIHHSGHQRRCHRFGEYIGEVLGCVLLS